MLKILFWKFSRIPVSPSYFLILKAFWSFGSEAISWNLSFLACLTWNQHFVELYDAYRYDISNTLVITSDNIVNIWKPTPMTKRIIFFLSYNLMMPSGGSLGSPSVIRTRTLVESADDPAALLSKSSFLKQE